MLGHPIQSKREMAAFCFCHYGEGITVPVRHFWVLEAHIPYVGTLFQSIYGVT